MFDPQKEPVLSLLFSKEHTTEALALLKILPVQDINRSLGIEGNLHRREKWTCDPDSRVSVLEYFLLNTQTYTPWAEGEGEWDENRITHTAQIAIELVRQGACLSNKGRKHNQKAWDLVDWAFESNHYDFGEFLLDGPLQHLQGSVEERQVGRRSLLNEAVHNNHCRLVKKFLSWGANPNTTDELGRSAVFYVKSPQVLKMLLHKGANIAATAADALGETFVKHWSKSLVASDVKRLNAALLKELQKTSGDTAHSLHASWMENILNATKGVITSQQKSLKIPSDFLWKRNGVAYSPLTWALTQYKPTRYEHQQEKIIAHLATDDQSTVFWRSDEMAVSNQDVVDFLTLNLDSKDFSKSGASALTFVASEKLSPEEIQQLFQKYTKIALLMTQKDVAPFAQLTAFQWFLTVSAGRDQAPKSYTRYQEFSTFQFCNQPPIVLQSAWQETFSSPLFDELRRTVFNDMSLLKGAAFVTMVDIAQEALSDPTPENISRVVRLLAVETKRRDLYADERYVPSRLQPRQRFAFKELLEQSIHQLESMSFGEKFSEEEWEQIKTSFAPHPAVQKNEIFNRLRPLIERESIARAVSASALTPLHTKRKM